MPHNGIVGGAAPEGKGHGKGGTGFGKGGFNEQAFVNHNSVTVMQW